MTAWHVLTANSTASGGSTAWLHLNSQAGGGTTTFIEEMILRLEEDTHEVQADTGDVSLVLDSNDVDVSIETDEIEVELDD